MELLDSTLTRTCRAIGEALLVPSGNWRKAESLPCERVFQVLRADPTCLSRVVIHDDDLLADGDSLFASSGVRRSPLANCATSSKTYCSPLLSFVRRELKPTATTRPARSRRRSRSLRNRDVQYDLGSSTELAAKRCRTRKGRPRDLLGKQSLEHDYTLTC
jgi:hypothetical protein